MRFESNLQNVMRALDEAEERALTAVGEFTRSESQVRSPVGQYSNPEGVYESGKWAGRSIGAVGGNLRDSNDYQVNMEEKTLRIGNSTEYGVFVHEGTSRSRPQPWLENSVMENVSRIKNLVKEMIRL